MAPEIAERANDLGASLVPREDFPAVCAEVNDQLGHAELQRIFSAIIGAAVIQPTPLLTRIAHAPSQIVITSNCDYSLEVAARTIDREPVTLHPRSALVTAPPAEGQLVVVHIHGVHDQPESVVLPGRSLDALAEDEPFKTALRMLLAPHLVLYLGYSFPQADHYLREEVEWVRSNLTDTGQHALLLPEHEYEDRRQDLDALGESIRIFPFDASRSYDAVQQAALTIAPSRQVVLTVVDRVVGPEIAPDFAVPPILRDEIDSESEKRQTRAMMARLGFGDDHFVEPRELLELGRALVIAEPGMGKTQLLLHLGGVASGFAPLYLSAKALVGALEPDRETIASLAVALRESKAFDDRTPLPTIEELDRTSYALLVDGLDEIRPDLRAALVDAVREIADRFPQHALVIASRPLLERTHAEELREAGFNIYRLVLDDAWGQAYLRDTRGIPQDTLSELYDRLPRANELLAIPLYAALIGNRLAEGAEALPETALGLITEVGVRDAIRNEAVRQGIRAEDLYHYLQTLALALEVRGLNEIGIDEALELPAPAGLSAEEIRAWLIEHSLLKDMPDRIAFQTVTIQEGLAAEALLATGDPLHSLHEVAVAEIGGEQVLRGGMDHALDLFFESANVDLRPSLRELDEMRWARTQIAIIPADEARETLQVIWKHYAERRNWIDSDRQRELRDARSTVERITANHPALIDEMRPTLLDALRSKEDTIRGNAIFYLGQAPFDDATKTALLPLLRDPNSVVRRFAASVIADRNEEGLRDAVIAAYRAETDEVAASELAHAILALTPEGQRLGAVGVLVENAIGWRRVSYLAEGLPLEDLLTILEESGIQNEDGRALEDAVRRLPTGEWTDELVGRLVALLIDSAMRSYYQFQEPELLRNLVERFPEGAVKGAETIAGEDPSYMDIALLRFVHRDRLEQALGGPLGRQISLLIELLIDRTPSTPISPTAEKESVPLSLKQWIAEERLSTERCPTRDTAVHGLLDQVGDLSDEEREKLEVAIRAWWPDAPLAEAIATDGRNGSSPPCFPAALAGYAALRLPIDRDQWLELLRANALWFYPSAAEWMAANYPGDVEDEVIAHLKTIGDEYLLGLALEALPTLSERLASAIADAMVRIGEDGLAFRLTRLREEDQLEALWRIADDASADFLRRAALRELARAGDPDAQHKELREMITDLRTNPHTYESQGLEWHSAAVEEALPELDELLTIVARTWSPSESEIGRTTVAAIAATGTESAIAIYDRLIDDKDAIGGSFYWYERERLRRQLASERVLARLPTKLGELAAWLTELGWDATDASEDER
jgi:HEAT repeat protein